MWKFNKTDSDMKKTGKIKYVLTAMMLMLLLSVPGCISEDCPECYEADKAYILLSIDGVRGTTRSGGLFSNDDDTVIKKLRVIVFNETELEANVLFTSNDDDFDNPFRVQVSPGKKNVYVIANEGASTLSTSLANTLLTEVGLKALMADDTSGELLSPLVMTGNISDITLVKGLQQSPVTLTRVSAKINIQLKKGVDDPVTITKISLLSNTGKTPLWEGGATIDNQDQTWWNHSTTFENHGLTNSFWNAHTVYVYENLGNSSGNKSKATQLELEALYGTVPTTYRVYINENVNVPTPDSGDPTSSVVGNPADHLYNIKRNHEYQLTGTISGIGEFDGLILNTNVLPWNLLTAEWEFDREYTIEPHPTAANKTFTVNNTGDKVDFTFKLTNSMEGTWMAHLSNPIDFEFSTAGGAVSSGQMGQQYTISVKPRLPQNDTERTTEFYITVDGVEVSLLSGSNQTGTGNRIVINQPATTP